MEKHFIVFLFKKFKAKKQNPNDPHKEVKSDPERWFFWAVVVRVPALIAKGPLCHCSTVRLESYSIVSSTWVENSLRQIETISLSPTPSPPPLLPSFPCLHHLVIISYQCHCRDLAQLLWLLLRIKKWAKNILLVLDNPILFQRRWIVPLALVCAFPQFFKACYGSPLSVISSHNEKKEGLVSFSYLSFVYFKEECGYITTIVIKNTSSCRTSKLNLSLIA